MGERIEVGRADEFAAGGRKTVRVRNREIGVFQVDGEFHALPNLCPHQLGPVCTGNVSGTFRKDASTDWRLEWVEEGHIVTCPWHGLEFRIRSGECLAYPKVKLRTYRTVVDDGIVYLEL